MLARWAHTARTVLVRGVVLGVALAATGTVPAAMSVHPDATRAGAACTPVEGPFRPSTVSIGGLRSAIEVLGRGQDRYGVPKPPPLTERGKWQFAWDKASGVRPGGAAGVVRLTAHTYPYEKLEDRPHDRASAPALGNLLLARLRAGDRIKVAGAGGERLCYRVTRRQQVRANASLSGYYDTAGPPRLAILVCSGTRRGPGDWTHRTIWWAQPVQDAS